MSQIFLDKTNAVRRRALTFVWIRAYCLTGVAIVCAVLLAVGLDYLLRSESVAVRWCYWLLILSAAAYAVKTWMWPAIQFQLSDVEVAKRIESAIGDPGNQISTSVEFAQAKSAEPQNQNEFAQTVIQKANQRIQAVRVGEVVHSNGIWLPLILLAATAALSGVGLAANTNLFGHGLLRLTQPWSPLEWPRENRLELNALPGWTPFGSDLSILVTDSNRNLESGAFVEIKTATSQRRLELSHNSEMPSAFSATIKNVTEDIQLRVIGGDDKTDWREVRVWRAPQIVDWQVRISPPQQFKQTDSTSNGPIESWKGAKFIATGMLDVPSRIQVQRATLVVSDSRGLRRFPLDFASGENQITTRAGQAPTILENGEYWVEFQLSSKDDHAVPSNQSESQKWPIQVFEDKPPQVQLTCTDAIVGPKSTVTITLDVRDEIGISQATVQILSGQEELDSKDILPLLQKQNESSWAATLSLSIGELPVSSNEPLTVRSIAMDLAGNRSQPFLLNLKVVEQATLLESLDNQTKRLAKRLLELSQQQTELSNTTKQLSSSQAADREPQLEKVRSEQNGIQSQLNSPTRGTIALNQQLVDFLNRHQLDPSGEDKRRKTLLLQKEALGFGSRMNSIRLPGQLNEFVDLQAMYEDRIGEASEILRSAATYSKLRQQASQIQRRQSALRDSIREWLSSQAERTRQETTRAASSMASQHRKLRRDTERFYSDLEFASRQSEMDPAVQERLRSVTEFIASSQLIGQMVNVDRALDNSMLGNANLLSGRVSQTLQQLVSILDPDAQNPPSADKSEKWIDEINQAIDELRQLESSLRSQAATSESVDDETRQRIDDRKKEISEQLDALQNEIGGTSDADLAKEIEQARTNLSPSTGNDAAALQAEADEIQSAISQLQQAAVKAAADQSNVESVDLRTTLRLMSQLKAAQSTINLWSDRRLKSSTSPDDKSWSQFQALQQTVRSGFQLARMQLESFATVKLLADPISNQLEIASERMNLRIVDSTTRTAQTRVSELMQQLIDAIEIQLDQKPQPPKQNQEEQSSDENQGNGISSFDLTLLYVMQKAINDDSRRLAMNVQAAGAESESQLQSRMELAARQAQLSVTIEQLLEQTQESIPELPDF